MQPIQYYSRKLNSAARNYYTGERELLAMVAACKRWRPYLAGKENTVLTDHKPLTAIYTQADLSKRQVRWMESWLTPGQPSSTKKARQLWCLMPCLEDPILQQSFVWVFLVC